jgi:hypothetical protein
MVFLGVSAGIGTFAGFAPASPDRLKPPFQAELTAEGERARQDSNL